MDRRCNTCHNPTPYNYCWTRQQPRMCRMARHDSSSYCWTRQGHLHSPLCQLCRRRPAVVKCFQCIRTLCYYCFDSEDHRVCVTCNHTVFVIPFSSHVNCPADPRVGLPHQPQQHSGPTLDLQLQLGRPSLDLQLQLGPPNQPQPQQPQPQQPQPQQEAAGQADIIDEPCFICTSSMPTKYCWVYREARVSRGSSHEPACFSRGHIESPLCQHCQIRPALIHCFNELVNICCQCFNAHHLVCIPNGHRVEIISFSSHMECRHPQPLQVVLTTRKRSRGPGRGRGRERDQQPKRGRGLGQGQPQPAGPRGGYPQGKDGAFQMDEFEDFLDSNLEMYRQSSVPNSGVVIEEIEDEEKPAKDSKAKRPKKKSQATKEENANKQIIVKESVNVPVLESEDENGFPIPKEKAPEPENKSGEKMNSDYDEQGSNKKRKAKASEQDGAQERSESSKTPDKSAEKKTKNSSEEATATVVSKTISGSVEKPKSDSIERDQVNSKASQERTYPNGLIVEELGMGKPDGKKATPGKQVSVRYIGKLQKNGKIFDSNIGKAPFKFRLGVGQVIKGWDVGVNGMRVGDKRKLTIPPAMGYGERGAGGQIPPNAWLTFDVELIDVK